LPSAPSLAIDAVMKKYKLVPWIMGLTHDETENKYEDLANVLNTEAQNGYKFVCFADYSDKGYSTALFEKDTGDNAEVILLRQLLRAYGHEPEA
jgi:hypothetical protein